MLLAARDRIAALDMLRALAVFLVIGHHAAWRFRPDGGDALGQMFKGSGWIGVDIFFAISGFMITTILIRDTHDVRGFFVRRVFRILPIFAVAMAAYIASVLATDSGAEKLRYIWSPALLLNGWTIPFLGYGVVPYTITWSLSVEETAYAILGLACLRGVPGLRAALIGFLVLGPVVRIAALAGGGIDLFELYFFVPARLDAIAFGGLAALIAARSPRVPPWLIPAAGVAVLAMVWGFQYTPVSHAGVVLVGYTAFAIATAALVAGLALQSASGSRREDSVATRVLAPAARGIATFGKLSYFIYLFHIFVLEALLQAGRLAPALALGFWGAMALATAIVFALAWVSWNYFEYPLIQYGRRRSMATREPARAIQ